MLLMIYCTAASTSCSYSAIWKTFLISEWCIRLCPTQLLHVIRVLWRIQILLRTLAFVQYSYSINDFRTGSLGPYKEIRSSIFLYGLSLRLFRKIYTLFGMWFSCLQIVCPIRKCPKIRQDKNSITLWTFFMPEQRKLEKWTIFCKSWKGSPEQRQLEKWTIFCKSWKGSFMLYGPAISQSDCRKAGSYLFPLNKHITVLRLSYKSRTYRARR